MIIGADVGTQSLKVAVLDSSMRLLGQASESYRTNYPKPGWVEQAPNSWTEALGPAIAKALKAANVAPTDVEAIGFYRPA